MLARSSEATSHVGQVRSGQEQTLPGASYCLSGATLEVDIDTPTHPSPCRPFVPACLPGRLSSALAIRPWNRRQYAYRRGCMYVECGSRMYGIILVECSLADRPQLVVSDVSLECSSVAPDAECLPHRSGPLVVITAIMCAPYLRIRRGLVETRRGGRSSGQKVKLVRALAPWRTESVVAGEPV